MKNSICKIYNNNKKGSGFFCKIPYSGKLINVLITCFHVFNDSDFSKNQKMKLYINDRDIFR